MTTLSPEPQFIGGSAGRLFTLHRAAQTINDHAECLILVPSFAEEMNRCRYMGTMLAQACQKTLPALGLLTIDPYGTGDSGGAFGAASWTQWLDDLSSAVRYARELGYSKVSLLGVRLGALLAFDALSDSQPIAQILLWQPVTNGKAALTQFLRLRVAAAASRGESGLSTGDLQAQIEAGNSIDIAGYEVSPALFNGIAASRLDRHFGQQLPAIGWFTTLPSEERQPARGELKIIEAMKKQSIEVEHRIAYGPSYWQVHERTLAPALIAETVAYLRERAGGHGR